MDTPAPLQWLLGTPLPEALDGMWVPAPHAGLQPRHGSPVSHVPQGRSQPMAVPSRPPGHISIPIGSIPAGWLAPGQCQSSPSTISALLAKHHGALGK